MNANPARAYIWEHGTATFMARAVNWSNVVITKATVASITYTLSQVDPNDETHNTSVTGHMSIPLTVASVIYDTLQTDSRWTADTTGYNFAYTLDVSSVDAFADAGYQYLLTFWVQPTVGQRFPLVFLIDLKSTARLCSHGHACHCRRTHHTPHE